MTSRTNPNRPPSSGGPRATSALDNGDVPSIPIAQNGDGQAAMVWLLQNAVAVHDFDVEINGKLFTFKYRRLLHDDTNRIGAEAWDFDPIPKDGQIVSHFNTTLFFRECLKRMFMQEDLVPLQPFPLTDRVIAAFPPEIGVAFTALIPNINAAVTAQKADDVKKE